MNRNLKDAKLIKSIALPAAASTAVTTADIDFGVAPSNGRELPEEMEIIVKVPALNTTMLPDTRTLTVQLQNGAAAAPTTAIGEPKVITGAGGVGSSAQEFRFRVPGNAARYLNAKFTTGASTTTMAAVSGELSLGF